MKKIVIIGAGPAGLASGYELLHDKKSKKLNVKIIDKNKLVGGLARTYKYKGSRFDIGPHRFYTKNKEVHKLWKGILKQDFKKVKRLTRMYYKGKLFLYPVELKDVVFKLGIFEMGHTFVSFAKARIFLRNSNPKNFEEWIIKYFGKKMFTIFFKTYTEKIWGIPCTQIEAKWASQRIKNLNLWEVIKKSVSSQSNSTAKSLIDEFYYPQYGAGQMYEEMAKSITKKGAQVKLNSTVTKITHKKSRIEKIYYEEGEISKSASVDYLLSSMPLTHFIEALYPPAPKEILQASRKIYYRDHITVNLTTRKTSAFSDNWIYIHEPGVKMARIANYNNMSTKMTAKKSVNAISVEYFAFRDDYLWNKSNKELIAFAKEELKQIHFLNKLKILDGFVVRETESYPVYYTGHEKYFKKIKNYVQRFENLELIGRGGMFKYNNMDHSMYSGMLAARNVLAEKRLYNTWEVNEDADYLEEKK